MAQQSPDMSAGAPATVGVAGVWRRTGDWMEAKLSPSPDLGSGWRLAAVGVTVALVVCVILARKYTLHRALGDTDDATRLMMVRDLLAGRGWYDQWIGRMAPPTGVYMHWSRLLDGGLAATVALLRGVMAPAAAEMMARALWPLAWIFPAILGALAVARNLGGRAAVFLTLPLLLLDLQLYRQFIPGRIDHHNIQIAMTVIALACALARGSRTRWAVAGGIAAALGLAIGLEALLFQAVIGASYGLDLARDRKAAAPAAAYGLSLAGGGAAFFLIQTPPWRWSLSFCDALSLNLVVALIAAGLGLALAAASAARFPAWVRTALLGATAALAAGAYVALAPACLHGPFAGMDPRVRAFWFNNIQEVQALPRMLGLSRLAAILAITMMAMSLVAGIYLVWREWPRPRTATLTAAACLILAAATAYFTWRMQDYVFWIGVPVLGAAYSWLAQRWLRDRMVPSLAAAMTLSPVLIGSLVGQATDTVAAPFKPPVDAGPRCFDQRAYGPLSRLPPGRVLASQDLGPYILATTRHSVVTAPYHRLSAAILAAHEAFDAPPALAEARVRRLGADYVIDCPPYPMMIGPNSFGARLRTAPPPAWLAPLSARGAALQIYRVRPPAGAGSLGQSAG